MWHLDPSTPRAATAALLLVLLSCSASTASAPATVADTDSHGMSAQAFAAWQDSAATTAAHARLARLAGHWLTHQRDWVTPGEPWNESDGLAEFRTELGGRFVTQHYRSHLRGQPYGAIATLGYDRDSGRYQSSWRDNFGTGLFLAAGTLSADGRVLTSEGPIGVPAARQARIVQTFDGDDHYRYEMFQRAPDGSWFRVVEIDYWRET